MILLISLKATDIVESASIRGSWHPHYCIPFNAISSQKLSKRAWMFTIDMLKNKYAHTISSVELL